MPRVPPVHEQLATPTAAECLLCGSAAPFAQPEELLRPAASAATNGESDLMGAAENPPVRHHGAGTK
ncbi:MAG TPA: hypothetical protein VKT77_10425 [Chthonomonadaceae bacterium]|nr:hypothetical protein [Chthonomonadaceae bacterium]